MSKVNEEKIIAIPLNLSPSHVATWQEIEAQAWVVRMQRLLKERRLKMLTYTQEHPHPRNSDVLHVRRLGRLILATRQMIEVFRRKVTPSA